MRFCPKCEEKYPDDEKRCHSCGRELNLKLYPANLDAINFDPDQVHYAAINIGGKKIKFSIPIDFGAGVLPTQKTERKDSDDEFAESQPLTSSGLPLNYGMKTSPFTSLNTQDKLLNDIRKSTERINDIRVPYCDETESETVSLISEAEDIAAKKNMIGSISLVTLYGTVPVHPLRLTSRVSPGRIGNRSIPVFFKGSIIGYAISEHYPDIETNDVIFEAVIEIDFLPNYMFGKKGVFFKKCVQKNQIPGPYPLEIHVETTEKATMGEILEIAKYHEKYYCKECTKIITGDDVHINSDCLYSCKHCGARIDGCSLEDEEVEEIEDRELHGTEEYCDECGHKMTCGYVGSEQIYNCKHCKADRIRKPITSLICCLLFVLFISFVLVIKYFFGEMVCYIMLIITVLCAAYYS